MGWPGCVCEMTRGNLLSRSSPSNTPMSRSNPAALRGVAAPRLAENGVDQYMEMSAGYLHSSDPQQDLQTPTPEMEDHGGVAQGWSEATLTEAHSGRYSAYSWSTEEGEFEKAATERVGQMFHQLKGELYEGRGSGFKQTDTECLEWTLTFPHFRVRGEHLLDSLEDGTEVAAPLERDDSSTSSTDNARHEAISGAEGLVVIGRHIEPISLSDSPEEDALKEEVIATHGVLEEYFAFDNSSDNGVRSKRRDYRGSPSVHRHLPPVTPEACVRHVVFSQVMDLLWSEVATVLQPLVSAVRDRALKEHTSRQSTMLSSMATSHSTSPHESHYHLPGLAGLPPHSTTGHQHTSQFYHGKPSTSSLALPALPQVPQPPALSGVMQIKPVSLRQRRAAMAPNEREEDLPTRFSLHPTHQQQISAESAALTQARLARHDHHPLLQRMSDYPPLSTPSGGHRQIFTRMTTTHRPQQLRPLDNPRTPALEKIEQTRIRGFKLSTSGLTSPPPTAGGGGVAGGVVSGMRNNQLPPLEFGSSGIPSATLLSETFPPVIRGKSTFSQRTASSAAFPDVQEVRRLQLSGRSSDMRPSTSSRAESGKPLGKKQLSDHISRGGMKIVGHATGLGLSISTAGSGVAGMDQMGGGKPYGAVVESIAEDEEEGEEGSGALNITGHSSGFNPSLGTSLITGGSTEAMADDTYCMQLQLYT